jgi:hypothetical protein
VYLPARVKTTAIEPAVTPLSLHLIGVRPLSLLLGQGGDEFAAEVGDHAAPDQVRDGREFQARLRRTPRVGHEWVPSPGWCTHGCGADAREEAVQVPAVAVVATDSSSVNADSDNGTTLQRHA